MAGRGSRFYRNGFPLPKPLIEIHGRPFFYWAVRSVEKNTFCADITFVILQEHVDQFRLDSVIRQYWPEARFVILPDVTEGAAVTAAKGIAQLPKEEPILFNDCDHLFRSCAFADFCREDTAEGAEVAGALLTFESDNPAYSYLQYDDAGSVARTIEKVVASKDAICGAYYFKNRAEFEKAYSAYLDRCEYREFFLSGVYNMAIEQGKKVIGLSTDFHLSFGTPEEYEQASLEKNNSYFEYLMES